MNRSDKDPDAKKSSLEGLRINRLFTERGIMSRREADQAVKDGRVTINGTVADLGARVHEGDEVTLDGKKIKPKQKSQVIIAYHKPVGIECTSDLRVAENIIDAVAYPERIFPIGRLDKMSEGLILLTNLGDIVNKILRSRYFHEKEYIVWLNGDITTEQINQLRNGIELSDGLTRPCKVKRKNARCIHMILTEGRNRQIRRMIEALNLRVSKLRRIRIMEIELGDLPYGDWRRLSKPEVKQLLQKLNLNI
ncbi:MAG: rRNA pseudouridine synthase [Oligoflexales bacterium]|nr:rRNA pseudouridine synthase [Oligoflexales bacterium]